MEIFNCAMCLNEPTSSIVIHTIHINRSDTGLHNDIFFFRLFIVAAECVLKKSLCVFKIVHLVTYYCLKILHSFTTRTIIAELEFLKLACVCTFIYFFILLVMIYIYIYIVWGLIIIIDNSLEFRKRKIPSIIFNIFLKLLINNN